MERWIDKQLVRKLGAEVPCCVKLGKRLKALIFVTVPLTVAKV